MARLNPRVTTNLPVEVDAKSVKTEMVMTNLGIGGAFLRDHSIIQGEKLVGNTVFLKYNLPNQGILEHCGKIIRKEKMGYALSFYQLDVATKVKIWDYNADKLTDIEGCPYCGEKYSTMPTVCNTCGWELTFNSSGYFEYHQKRSTLKKLYSKLESLGIDQLQRAINFLDIKVLKLESSEELQEFIGTSSAMLEVFSKIRKVAPTDLSVLILGESGTGKELTALAIHERSQRSEKPFLTINCAAIPESLLEAELFGYEKGAFTGAYTSKSGKCELADSGTLFLDEIGEFSPGLQAKLLRFLEDKVIEKIGATRGKKVDVRVIAATNRELGSAIAEGNFRNDLYYRLNEFTINLPPVRERGEDKLIIAKFFLNKSSSKIGSTKTFSKKAIESIMTYDWPGNVREIINRTRRAIVMADSKTITPENLGFKTQDIINSSEGFSLKNVRSKIEEQRIKEVLSICGNNISKTAKMLGISRPSLYNHIKKYPIKYPFHKK